MVQSGSEGKNGIKGTVFNIQRYSIQDGPGIRTTVFVKGCPLRCLWCSNPESQNMWPEVAHRDSLCDKCGRCIDACKLQAISVNESGVHINRKLCDNCGKCVEACIPGALSIFGNEMSVEEVLREVKKDIEYYQTSGGGVTVSGGEPLSQPTFVAALFRRCRDAGIHTTLDTSGCVGSGALEAVLPYTSLVLFDVKHTDNTAHQKWTKRSNRQIIRNLQLIAARGTPLVVRVPLIPGVNDSEEELKAITRMVSSYGKKAKINLLPYHRYGVGKYKMLDRRYRLGGLVRQPDTEIQRARQIVESSGIECDIVL